jgi:hypothetical protein
MAAKTIQISADGVTYSTLPGNTGDFSAETTQLDDSIFGTVFSSTQPGLINWSVSANAMYRGFAGYVASVLRSGTSTAFTTEAMTGSGDTWQITDATKRIWDRSEDVTVSTGTIESINYLTGTITFTGSVSTPTVSGSYFPTVNLGCSNSFNLTQTSDTTDTTCFETARENGGFATHRATLKTVELELTGFYRAANQFYDMLQGRGEMIVEINPDGNGKSVARGYFKPVTDSQTGDVGGDETETVSFRLSTPSDVLPFTWTHANDSTIPDAVKILLDAWANSDEVYVRYLAEGVGNEGRQGTAIVTDISLSQSVDGMSEFSVELKGTDTAIIINQPSTYGP